MPLGGDSSLSSDSLLSRWDMQGRSSELLEQLCSDHPGLADELRSRAGALRIADAALASSAGGVASRAAPPDIPGYRIVRLVGEGGMGTIWEALHVSTNRRVALKLLPAWSLGSPRAQARFEREVELASRLDHPNIAKVFDSDLHDGLFYFSMELIDGVQVDQFFASPPPATDGSAAPAEVSRAGPGSPRGQLATLLTITQALAHAHTRGVIHRDLKPTNILVAPDGAPHLLDFGLARDATADSTLTLDSPFAGTPGYCSPEQARGEATDTRSDLFSLGLIAALLLTERHPYDLSLPAPKLLRHIAATPAKVPHTPDLRRLPSDIRLVLAKSIAFAPAERYQSANEFAADLQALLANRPLLHARRPTLGYRARKFAGRNARPIAAASIVLALAASAAAYTFARVRSERARAARSAQIAAEANLFMSDLLQASTPESRQGRELTVADVLDRAAARIDGQRGLPPEVEAAIRQNLAAAYGAQDVRPAEAESQRRRAIALLERSVGPHDPATLEARLALAGQVASCNRGEEGIAMAREVFGDARAHLGPDADVTLGAAFFLCKTLFTYSRPEDRRHADELLARAPDLIARLDARGDPDLKLGDPDMLRVMVLACRGKAGDPAAPGQMVVLCRRVHGRAVSRYGGEDFRAVRALMNLGIALRGTGELSESESDLREAVRVRHRIYGDDHGDTIYAEYNLGLTLGEQGRLDASRNAEAASVMEGVIARIKAWPTPVYYLGDAEAALADVRSRGATEPSETAGPATQP